MLTYLEVHTQNIQYLVAVPSAQTGSSLVLQTGRPVLFMGGFAGSDPVVNAISLYGGGMGGETLYQCGK